MTEKEELMKEFKKKLADLLREIVSETNSQEKQ